MKNLTTFGKFNLTLAIAFFIIGIVLLIQKILENSAFKLQDYYLSFSFIFLGVGLFFAALTTIDET